MADQSIRGRFVWHELMTPDIDGAHAFYSKALGWKSENWDQDPSYRMFVAPSGPLGGAVAEPNGAPQWLAYIGSDDVAATVARAKELGGSVVKDATGMPNGGTYAILADPQGARFGVYAREGVDHGPDAAPQRGEFSWHELATTDYRAAFEFYSALFGWENIAEHDMGEMGKYFIFGTNGVQKGGMFTKPAEMRGPPFWLGYVRVTDVNQTVDKVKAARGSLINGPMEVPGGDWIAQFTDPYGAMFAAHTVASDLKTAKAAPPREVEQTSSEPPAGERAERPAAPRKKAAKKAAKAPAKKSAGAKAKKKAARKAAAKGKAAGKKKAARKGKAPARKKAGKKRPAAHSAKRPARKTAGKAKRGAGRQARRKK